MEMLLGKLDDVQTRHAIQQVYDEVVTGKKEMEKEITYLKLLCMIWTRDLGIPNDF